MIVFLYARLLYMNHTLTATSASLDATVACAEISGQLNVSDFHSAFILIFCSSQYDLSQLATKLQQQFPHTPCFGCTTAGEFAKDGYKRETIVAVSFSSEYFIFSSALVTNLKEFDLVSAKELMNDLNARLVVGQEDDFVPNNFVLSLVDGLSSKEEEFLLNIDSAMSGIPHFGGSAGDDQMLNNTYVLYDGKFHDSAAVIINVHSTLKFRVFTVNHIAESLGKLVVTDADPATRQVFEINAEPAAQVYADLVGKTVETLEPDDFALYPLAVKVGNEYYIRSIQRATDAFHSLSFYCAVDIGIVLNKVSLRSINDGLHEKLSELQSELGKPAMVLGMDCFLRRVEVEHKGLCNETKELHQQYNIVGFNAYGEHIKGIHLNQTFTGVYLSEETHG